MTVLLDLINRKSWAPWAPMDYGVGAHGGHRAQLGPIPDKKKVEVMAVVGGGGVGAG